MNWFDQMEQKRKLIIGGLVIICLAILWMTARRNHFSFDSFWHLKMGLDWLENDLSLWRDHFSFTYNGKEIANVPYMFQTLLGWLVLQFGHDTGFEVYKISGFILVFSLVIWFLHKLRSPVIIYCLVLPLLVVLLQIRSTARPELLSYSFSILAIIVYYRANNKISTANMLSIMALMWLWSNYHTSIFGYVIFLGFFIDLAVQQIRQRSPGSIWLKWLLWGMAIFAVGFLKPGFSHPVIGIIFFDPEWKTWIQEYQSALVLKHIPAVYSLVVISLITVIVLLRNRQFGLLFICLFLSFHSVNMSRLVTPSGIVILCIFAWAMSELDVKSRIQHMPQHLNQVFGAGVAVIFIISLASSVYIARSHMAENRIATLFPEDVANYMIDHHIQGRIFNDDIAGNYLIYRLSPDSQVYIDSRSNILYPLEHLFRYLDATRSSEVLRAEIETYDIDLAVLLNRPKHFSLVHDTGMLSLDYIGNRYSLFRRDNPNFPLTGVLLASPACWNAGMSAALETEQAKARQILPGNSFISPSFIKFVIDFGKIADRKAFLSSLQIDKQWSATKLRFTAYQALSENLNMLAYKLFINLTDAEFSDFLAAALAQARQGEWKRAEQILDNVIRQKASYKPTEIKILHNLLVQIRQNHTLELFDDTYLDQIAEGTTSKDEAALTQLPSITAFCPKT
jgi:hypothetical protein